MTQPTGAKTPLRGCHPEHMHFREYFPNGRPRAVTSAINPKMLVQSADATPGQDKILLRPMMARIPRLGKPAFWKSGRLYFNFRSLMRLTHDLTTRRRAQVFWRVCVPARSTGVSSLA
jgi:hypothetical protein